MEKCKSERVLVDHQLRAMLLEEGLFVPGSSACPSIADTFIQPASLDLPVMNQCYLVKDRVLPYRKTVSELIPTIKIMQLDLSAPDGAVLLKGQTYLAHCGRVKMPPNGTLTPSLSEAFSLIHINSSRFSFPKVIDWPSGRDGARRV